MIKDRVRLRLLAVKGLGPVDREVIIAKKAEDAVQAVSPIVAAIGVHATGKQDTGVSVGIDDLAAQAQDAEVLRWKDGGIASD